MAEASDAAVGMVLSQQSNNSKKLQNNRLLLAELRRKLAGASGTPEGLYAVWWGGEKASTLLVW